MISETGDKMKERNSSFWGFQLLEGIILFIGLPLFEYTGLNPLPKLVLLGLAATYCGYVLWRDSSFKKGLLQRSDNNQISKTIVLRSLIIIPGLLGLVWLLQPEYLFAFPLEQPWMWMPVMVIYPIFSVLPQEFIYRTFFFYRYKHFFAFKNSDILLSALAYSFLHVVYDNWWAVVLSFLGGILFGMTYKRTESLYWVIVEHLIYGWWIFTIGMGTYFFEGF